MKLLFSIIFLALSVNSTTTKAEEIEFQLPEGACIMKLWEPQENHSSRHYKKMTGCKVAYEIHSVSGWDDGAFTEYEKNTYAEVSDQLFETSLYVWDVFQSEGFVLLAPVISPAALIGGLFSLIPRPFVHLAKYARVSAVCEDAYDFLEENLCEEGEVVDRDAPEKRVIQIK